MKRAWIVFLLSISFIIILLGMVSYSGLITGRFLWFGPTIEKVDCSEDKTGTVYNYTYTNGDILEVTIPCQNWQECVKNEEDPEPKCVTIKGQFTKFAGNNRYISQVPLFLAGGKISRSTNDIKTNYFFVTSSNTYEGKPILRGKKSEKETSFSETLAADGSVLSMSQGSPTTIEYKEYYPNGDKKDECKDSANSSGINCYGDLSLKDPLPYKEGIWFLKTNIDTPPKKFNDGVWPEVSKMNYIVIGENDRYSTLDYTDFEKLIINVLNSPNSGFSCVDSRGQTIKITPFDKSYNCGSRFPTNNPQQGNSYRAIIANWGCKNADGSLSHKGNFKYVNGAC